MFEFIIFLGQCVVSWTVTTSILAVCSLLALRIAPRLSAKNRYRIYLAIVIAILVTLLLALLNANHFELTLNPVAIAKQVDVSQSGDKITATTRVAATFWMTPWFFRALGVLWIVGTIIFLGIHLRILLAKFLLTRRSINFPATLSVRRKYRRLTKTNAHPIARRIVVANCQDVPAITGWRGNVILLPASAKNWEPEELEVVIAHEYAHIRGADFFKSLFIAFVSCLNWHNPIMWSLAQNAYNEREVACDERVLVVLNINAVEYFERLLSVARQLHADKPFIPSIGTSRSLLKRVQRLTVTYSKQRFAVRFTRCIFVLPILIVLALLPLVQFSSFPSQIAINIKTVSPGSQISRPQIRVRIENDRSAGILAFSKNRISQGRSRRQKSASFIGSRIDWIQCE